METKFPVGSQWKTLGGWRAVVVKQADSTRNMIVWHESRDKTIGHDPVAGRSLRYLTGKAYDLLSPWTEPRKGEFWVNVYEKAVWDFETKEKADSAASQNRLACVRVEWTEGQGL